MHFSRPSQSLWSAKTAKPEYQPLGTNASCNVAIIGGGIAGVTTAYLLAKEGLDVILFDDGPIAGGQTERTTAHITAFVDQGYDKLVHLHGAAKVEKIAASHKASIEKIEQIVTDEAIDCDFMKVDGYLFLGREDKTESLFREMQAMQSVGFTDVVFGETHLFAHQALPYLMLGHQAQFDVLKYISALMEKFVALGGRVYTETHISEIKNGKPAELTTINERKIMADNVVVATGSPISDFVAIHTKQTAYRTYVIAGQVDEEVMPPGLFMDTEEPYHYIRTAHCDGKLYAIIGGEDHRTGQENDYESHYRKLEDWARFVMPQLGPIEYEWSGQVYEPVDGLAYIGKDPEHSENIFVATGFSGSGITQGTIAAMIVSDLIGGRENFWSEIYEPTRKTAAALPEYIKENFNTAKQYSDYLTGGEVDGVVDIPPGEGAVISKGVKHYAVYKDENGSVFECSAVCPHLMAIVSWNAAEKTWDCPAHGSRFDCTGHVIDGPAISDLDVKCMEADGENNQIALPLTSFDQTA